MTALVITRPGPVVPRRYTLDEALRPVRVEDDHGKGGVTVFEPAELWTPADVVREAEAMVAAVDQPRRRRKEKW